MEDEEAEEKGDLPSVALADDDHGKLFDTWLSLPLLLKEDGSRRGELEATRLVDLSAAKWCMMWIRVMARAKI